MTPKIINTRESLRRDISALNCTKLQKKEIKLTTEEIVASEIFALGRTIQELVFIGCRNSEDGNFSLLEDDFKLQRNISVFLEKLEKNYLSIPK